MEGTKGKEKERIEEDGQESRNEERKLKGKENGRIYLTDFREILLSSVSPWYF